MVEFKKRYIDAGTKKMFDNLEPLKRDLLASRLKLDEVDDFTIDNDPIEPMLKDPKLQQGATLLNKVIREGGSILVITDGDCDGISCAGVANLFFKNEHSLTPVPYPVEDPEDSTLHFQTDKTNVYTDRPIIREMNKGELYLIVNDRAYGNGVNLKHAKYILDYQPDLIITADHGSADHKTFDLIRELLPNTKILITDHHVVPDDIIPVNDAFINPQDTASTLGKGLCGAAVLYLLFRAASGKELTYLYPIVGLATIGDVMPLNLNYNRFLYNQANAHLKSFKPFRSYVRYAKHRYLWSSEFYSIGLAPLINSTKRMGKPLIGYRFLTATDENEVFKYYNMMVNTNKARKKQQQQVELSIESSLREDRDKYEHSRIATTEIPNGVNGILASRLVESDYVPTFVFHKTGNIYSGSGRGYGDFDVENLISVFRKSYPNVYISGGGHKGAGGLKLKATGFYLFRGLFERLASRTTKHSTEYYDIELPLELVHSKSFRKVLRSLQPFGREFPYPTFKTTGTIHGFQNYGPVFYIYKIAIGQLNLSMMRFSEIPHAIIGKPVKLFVSPRGKKDFILIDSQ